MPRKRDLNGRATRGGPGPFEDLMTVERDAWLQEVQRTTSCS
jgi:hypothetical protein